MRVIEKCSTGAFCGVCNAGVKEFIYPINNNSVTVGFISVSGYKSDKASIYIDVVSEKYKLPKENLISAYDTLKDDIPAKTFIDTLITPLCCSLPCKLLSASPELTTLKKWLNSALQLTKWC